jgi:rfaE bifunctional protein nucleotidyltransferase chain/domain
MLPIEKVGVFSLDKIVEIDIAASLICKFKSENRKVGLCHGGFDLLHPGHIKHFESAKKLCDMLFVSVTSDRFVAGRKGSGRPIFNEQLRAYSIAALEMVNYVVITDFEKAVPILKKLKPSFYIKGPDFIEKTTPGITAEREAIARVGGEMKYTTDIKLSTTAIIDYIKNQLDVPEILVIIDRDGTLINNDDFPGKNVSWKEKLQFNEAVLGYLSYLQTKYKTTKIVITNQAGVARGYFDCARVEEMNNYIHGILAEKGINIARWEYCPEVDAKYASLKKEIYFDSRYIKEETKRKPSPVMVFYALEKLNRKKEDFSQIIVIGDKESDDGGLAKNLGAKFINVAGKCYEELKKELS